jgi:hypothetical protein
VSTLRQRLCGDDCPYLCIGPQIAVQAAPVSAALASICTADALIRWNRSSVSPKDPLEHRRPVAPTWPPSQVEVCSANDSTALSHFLLDPRIASGVCERRGRFGAAQHLLGFKAQTRGGLAGCELPASIGGAVVGLDR